MEIAGAVLKEIGGCAKDQRLYMDQLYKFNSFMRKVPII